MTGAAARIRSHRPGRALALFTVISITGGCIAEEREQEIGDTMASEVNPHLPLIEDPLLTAYLHEVGGTIGRVSGRPELEYKFYIINTGVVNAFALPGGHIYLTRGLIQRTQDGAEFAGVLAHEIGHVAARHGIRKLQRHLRTGSLVNVLYNTILGGEPAILRENSLQMADVIWSAQHSRRDEREADRLAVKYLMLTGVDPEGVVSLLQGLADDEAQEGVEWGGGWFATHPMTTNRIRDARRNIGRLQPETDQVLDLDLEAFPAFRMLVTRTGRYFHDPLNH